MLNQLWLQLSKGSQQDPTVIKQYVARLINANETLKAEKLLKQSLKQNWNEHIIELYELFGLDDLKKSFKTLEGFLKIHKQSSSLYLTLGIIAKKLQLWGKGKDYLNNSIDIKPTARAYFELGELYRSLDEEHIASEQYEKGLRLALN